MVLEGAKAVLKIIFHPKWFLAILDEAQRMPAIVAGIAFIWLTMIGLSAGFSVMFWQHAQAAEERDNQLTAITAQMQTVLANNTKALNCSRMNNDITEKGRVLNDMKRLLERAEDAAEQRRLTERIGELERAFDDMRDKYKTECS